MASSSPDDDFDFDFDDSLFDAAAREILDAGGYDPKMLTGKNGSALIGETFRAFDEAIGSALGSKPDPAVAAALRENAFIFSGFKTHAELEQVAQLITDENGNIRPFNEFLNDVKQLNQDYNHRYLRTEYNQAVQSAQMASKWADFERDKDFINLQYRTANDERVRASHRILHGVTLPVDDKFWQQYTPPNGWGCRCTVVAVPKDDPDFPVRDAQGSTINGKEVFPTPAYEIFKTNTAKAKKVFPDKHPYLPKSCNTCPLNTERTLSRKDIKRDCTICDTRKKHFEWKESNLLRWDQSVIDRLSKDGWTIKGEPTSINNSDMAGFDLLQVHKNLEDFFKTVEKNVREKTNDKYNIDVKGQRLLRVTKQKSVFVLYDIGCLKFAQRVFQKEQQKVAFLQNIHTSPAGCGIGAKVILEMLTQYLAIGVDTIKFEAGKSVGDRVSGGYVWAKMGFYALDKQEALKTLNKIEDSNLKEFFTNVVNDYYKKWKLDDTAPFPMREFIEKECDATFLMTAHWRGVLDLHNPEMVNGVMNCCKKKIYEVEKGETPAEKIHFFFPNFFSLSKASSSMAHSSSPKSQPKMSNVSSCSKSSSSSIDAQSTSSQRLIFDMSIIA